MALGGYLDNMSRYDIFPIALCEGPRPISHFAYRSEEKGTANTACYIWYLAGSGPNILVDAGADAADFVARGAPETDIVSVKDGLQKLKLTPDDIAIVILTHLHCDHIALGHLYKNARFIVQKKEWEYAQNPHPVDAMLYDKSFYSGLNLEIIDGNKEITPGIDVLLTPGHSPGGQSVVINTTAGKAVITGFCATKNTFVPTQEMKTRGWEATIPLIHHDALATYNSVLEIKRRADILIPLHDPAFISKKIIP